MGGITIISLEDGSDFFTRWRAVPASALGVLPAGAVKKIDDMMETELSTLSGSEPCVSVWVIMDEAGKQTQSTCPGPESGVPMSDAVDEAAHAW